MVSEKSANLERHRRRLAKKYDIVEKAFDCSGSSSSSSRVAAVANEYGVNRTLIYKWRSELQKDGKLRKSRRFNRPHPRRQKYSKEYQFLKEFYESRRSLKIGITHKELCSAFKEEFPEYLSPERRSAYRYILKAFCQKNKVVLRNKSHEVPVDRQPGT
uniref:Uncharacterized protein n=1 Tax=Rhodosorus marinus TaxID=101924 RepID=A0A7S2ZJR8_9RHOD|mmetsp:Transcript_19581/g.78003  ORF Transcript_19581/g.78003 Transcript_19581/m.78003 type:complete len:159 (+) Transcript_19581:93-569(+)